MPTSATQKRIALAFPMSVPHLADFMSGVVEYARTHCDWVFTICPAWTGGFPETFTMSMENLQGWQGDGAIGVITTPEEAEAACRLDFPVVNLSGTLHENHGVPRVMVNHESIGRTAASHFLAKGFKQFAYYGISEVRYGTLRFAGFASRLHEAGYTPCDMYEDSPRTDAKKPWLDALDELGHWLARLEKPIALFVINDYRACLVLEQCQRMGIRIPNDIALLAVDNDTVICEHSTPTLSSVSRNGHRVGYEAAMMLDSLLQSKQKDHPEENMIPGESIVNLQDFTPQTVLVEPGPVIQRESTDIMAIENPHIARAIQLMHDNLSRPYDVKCLLRELGVSRRFLERHFRDELQCTPHEYLAMRRIEKAKRLLQSREELTVREIAEACGQSDPRSFRKAFHRMTGMLPSEYRKQAGH